MTTPKSSIHYSQEQFEDIKEAFKAYRFESHVYPQYRSGQYNDVLRWLFSWFEAKNKIQELSLETCPSCKLDPDNTPGGSACRFCGMIGQQPWGG